MHDIRYDAVNDEFLVTNPFAQALLVFRGGADGEESPIRVIQGPHTQLVGSGISGVDRLDVDPVHNEIFVPNGDSILVFPREATGDVAPIRVIKGPDTQLRSTGVVVVDPIHNLIVVVDSGGRALERTITTPSGGDRGGTILIYNRTDNGNVKPRNVIWNLPGESFRTSSQIQVYPPKGWIIVPTETQIQNQDSRVMEREGSGIGVWSIDDNGEVPPRWKITGPKTLLKRPRGLDLDPKNKELIVADMRLNAIVTYYFPEIF